VAHIRAGALLCALFASGGSAEAAVSARALQERRLEAGKAALERLRGDAKRRRHRDAWEAVIRELDGAVRAAPSGARAPEAALWSARAREDLWNVSRSRRDALAAVECYRKVDEAYTGSAQAPRALLLAVQMARRTGEVGAARSAQRRLTARYGGTPEAKAAELMTRAEERDQPKARAPSKAGRRPGSALPAEDEEDEDSEPASSAEAKAEEAGKAPGREDPREEAAPAAASKLLEQVIEAAKTQASTAADKAGGAQGGGELPPEPEAPEPIEGLTIKAAEPPRPQPPPARAEAAKKARELRSAARKAPASVAAQLGLKMRRVVIDPGHGGRDTGAVGPHGIREKDVALAIARELAQRLRALGFSVILTRKDDSYVSLDERTRIANQARADLFVSIHCNAARRRTLSGVETWTLNVASDRYSARLATFENAEAERTVSDLRLILADLATRANASDARDLAQSVQGSLVRHLRARMGKVPDHGVKQALFYVLLGARMPAILVETGFISNPSEEARLRSRKYQAGAAEAIALGVKEFVEGRQRLAQAP
jgi:N-acetylmuramoyl-L-alanine amidase